jgi:hypothetical protein
MEHSWPAAHNADDWWWMFDPRRSLRARAVLVFGSAALALTLLLGWAAESLFRRQLSAQVGASFETLALQIGDKLDRALDERLRALQLAASLAPLKNPATPVAERRALLDALLDAAPDLAWIGVTDRDGHVIAAAQSLFENTSVATSPWFRGAQRGPFAGSVHEFAELARELPRRTEDSPRFLDLAVPINDAEGNFLGVLGAHVRWSWARDTQRSVVPDTARRDHLGVTIYSATGEVLHDSGASGWTHPPDAPEVSDRIGLRGNFVESVAGDADYVTGFARTKGYREFRGANWLVVVRQPTADVVAAASDLRRWIVWLGFALTLVTVIVSWLVAGRLARRMAAVTAAAGRIRRGDALTLMPRPAGHGELEEMCGAIGDMVDNFRAKQEKSESAEKR